MARPELAHSPLIHLVIVMRLRLDGELIAALLQTQTDFRVLCATTSVEVASTVGRHRRLDVVLLDGELVDLPDCESIASLMQQLGDVPILVLDVKVNHGRLAALLDAPCAGYFTRGAPFAELAEGIRRLSRGESAFDSTLASRIEQTPRGRIYRLDSGTASSLPLTPREIEVWKLIAQGSSVKRCAELLHLAPSTVDNHKSHLMKKLGVHKAIDLTRMAIRDGLISF